MQENLYEYAVIRVVPKVEREEFINVGIILFCKSAKRILVKYQIDENKLACFNSDLDIDLLRQNLDSFEKIGHGRKTGGPIASFDVPSRFRWLTAVRSSSIQTSRPHPGFCTDLVQTLGRLFQEQVT